MVAARFRTPMEALIVVFVYLPFAAAEPAAEPLSPTNTSALAKARANWKDRGEEFFKVEEDEPVGVGRFNDSLTHQEAVLETVRLCASPAMNAIPRTI